MSSSTGKVKLRLRPVRLTACIVTRTPFNVYQHAPQRRTNRCCSRYFFFIYSFPLKRGSLNDSIVAARRGVCRSSHVDCAYHLLLLEPFACLDVNNRGKEDGGWALDTLRTPFSLGLRVASIINSRCCVGVEQQDG